MNLVSDIFLIKKVAKICKIMIFLYIRGYPSQQQDVDPTLVHGWHGWSNVAVGMPTFAPRWANVSSPTVGLIWLAQCWYDL